MVLSFSIFSHGYMMHAWSKKYHLKMVKDKILEEQILDNNHYAWLSSFTAPTWKCFSVTDVKKYVIWS